MKYFILEPGNIERSFPWAPALTPALSHPMGEGEVVPALEEN